MILVILVILVTPVILVILMILVILVGDSGDSGDSGCRLRDIISSMKVLTNHIRTPGKWPHIALLFILRYIQ